MLQVTTFFPFDTARYDVYEDEDGTPWACNADTLHLRFYGQNGKSSETTATYLDLRTAHLLLDEEAGEHPVIESYDGPALLQRQLTCQVWNTVCLPFNLSRADAEIWWGNDVRIARFLRADDMGSDAATIVFRPHNEGITANEPCIVWVDTPVAGLFTLDNHEIHWEEEPKVVRGGISFLGNYTAGKTVPVDDYYLSNNNFFLSRGLSTMSAYRGWFHDESATNGRSLRMQFVDDDDTTTSAILPTVKDEPPVGYDLRGIRRPSAPRKGIFIYDGHRFVYSKSR